MKWFWKFPFASTKRECKRYLSPGWRIQIPVRSSYDQKHRIGIGSVLNSFCENQLVSRLASSLSKRTFSKLLVPQEDFMKADYNFF